MTPARTLLFVAAVALAAPLALATYAATAAPAARELARSGPIAYDVPLRGAFVRGERLVAGREVAWTTDGARIAFVRGYGSETTIYVAEADGSRQRRLARGRTPSWSPDGKRVVAEVDGRIVVIRADRVGQRELTAGTAPEWSPGGEWIAYECTAAGRSDLCLIRPDGTGRRPLTNDDAADRWPTWSPRGTRIAYTRDDEGITQIHAANLDGKGLTRLTNSPTLDERPSWSPDGTRIAFVRDGAGWTMNADGTGAQQFTVRAAHVAWRPLPRRAELLPDLDQRAPHSLSATRWRGRWVLAFASAVDNVGDGPLWLIGQRRAGTAFMDGGQRVRRADTTYALYRDTGFWRYVYADSHDHWHFLPFARYELRNRDGRVVVRDHKSGFCLGDTFRNASGRVKPGPYFFPSGDCNKRNPRASDVYGGTTVGYTDRYFPNYHGQNLSLVGVPAGVYTLVHRVNPELNLYEKRYDNNVASVRIRLTWRGGVPRVSTLKSCDVSALC